MGMSEQHAHQFFEDRRAFGGRFSFQQLIDQFTDRLVILMKILENSFSHLRHPFSHL
jgi:hypothetical protein